ncbi:hypothetical protein M758_4G148300 [Ceratodon purpureus]|uniref:Uncharacterized protein n=1 Tax=Ceratodon purpureus TaxID=3225 RepID=A0A8T0IAY2_CERPU|nr:hypothetical protein KC19_4G146800 [Ceratodon purpureus]KAG0619564.1 hypothetical protein M758_4G148300 [Ceratodon purpureus]
MGIPKTNVSKQMYQEIGAAFFSLLAALFIKERSDGLISVDSKRPSDPIPAVSSLNTPRMAEPPSEVQFSDHEVKNLSVDDNLPSAPVPAVNPMNIPRVTETLSEDQLQLPMKLLELRDKARKNPDVLEHNLSILFKKDNSWAVTPLVT